MGYYRVRSYTSERINSNSAITHSYMNCRIFTKKAGANKVFNEERKVVQYLILNPKLLYDFHGARVIIEEMECDEDGELNIVKTILKECKYKDLF